MKSKNNMLRITKTIIAICGLGLFLASCDTAKTAMTKPAAVQPTMAKNDDMAMKKFMNTIDPAEVRERLFTFASHDFEGRRTGTRGQKRAAEYLSNFYHKLGLKGPMTQFANPYLQPINFKETLTKSGAITLGDKDYLLDKDFGVLAGIGTDNTTDVLFIGHGIQTDGYDDLAGMDLNGKTVVLIIGDPRTSSGEKLFDFSQQESFEKKEKFFTNLGVANMIVTMPNQAIFDSQIPFMKSGRASIELSLGEDEEGPAFSTFFMSPTAVADMFGHEREAFFNKVQAKIDDRKPSGGEFMAKDLVVKLEKADRMTESHNVMAFLEGTDLKDEIIVISSHYDHDGIKNGVIYPGADDDGSGTMGVMELAEAFTQAANNGNRQRRSILFLNVTGEEEGLLGSKYYADVAPVFPLSQTVTNLNIDMIGRIDPKHEADSNYVYIIGSDYLSTELHATHERVSKKHFPDMEMDFTYNDKNDPNRFYYRSDHYNFAKNNIPIIFYFNGTHDDYHQPSDTPDKISYDMLAQRTKLIFATAWELANMDKKPAVDVVQEP